MAEKNAREILIEKFLTGHKITQEEWVTLLTAYALVEEAAKNTIPATIEEVMGGSDNEKFITSFLLDYFLKNKIIGLLKELEKKLTIKVDSTPTENSNNPVSSGSVFTGLGKMLEKDGSMPMTGPLLLADGGFMFNSNGGKDTGIKWLSDGRFAVVNNGVVRAIFEADGRISGVSNPTNPQDVATKDFLINQLGKNFNETIYSDFNNIKESGCYYIGSDQSLQQIANRPSNNSGYLEVTGSSGTDWVLQRYTVYLDTTLVYTRRLYAGSWSAWVKNNNNFQILASGNIGSSGILSNYSSFDDRILTVGKIATGEYQVNHNLGFTTIIGLATNFLSGAYTNVFNYNNSQMTFKCYNFSNIPVDSNFNFIILR